MDRDPDYPGLYPDEVNDVIMSCYDVEDVLIKGFTLEHGQCGISCGSSSVKIDDCRIRDIYYYFPDYLGHSDPSYAISLRGTEAKITNSMVILAGGGSGFRNFAFFCYDSSPLVLNCLFVYNENGTETPISCMSNSKPKFINCTIANNTGYGEPVGAVQSKTGSMPVFTNCIIWNNGPVSIIGNAKVNYSDVEGGYGGEGNIDADPLFESSSIPTDWQEHFYLNPASPCIDAGGETMTFGLDEMTTSTSKKPDTGRMDMGYHYPVSDK
jgi:hypothetical protein